MIQGLNSIVYVLVISAGALAFIVLYNLNYINIAERRRELATLKVLGFYDIEVAEYIYRENIIITVIGIVLGMIFGYFLHQYVIQTSEINVVMFGRKIGVLGYVLGTITTILFAVLINLTMYFKLKKVDMATSLKSGE
jgi:putative ABC transport system permease protein